MSALKAWRNSQEPKLNQVALARRLRTTQSHISEIENNEDGVSLETAARIFVKTGVRVGKMKTASDKQARAIAEAVGAK